MHSGRTRTDGMQHNTDAGPPLVGRERELRAALGLLEEPGPRALILAGEPGIGKTTIWRELLGHARSRGFDVLRAIPSGAEVQLTFAALGDLVDGVGERALAQLAAPQRRALEIALLRVEGPPVDARAVRVALLELLRNRAAERPVLIGIDDLQWLDGPSAKALSFALRRCTDTAVFVAATLRSGEAPAFEVEDALGADRVDRLELGPLTLAAIHELIAARTHLDLPRPTIVALFDAAAGNPFVAGELARELKRRGAGLHRGELPPVPPSVRQLVSARVGRLAPEVAELLLAAAGLARPTVELLGRLAPDAESSLRPAVEAGVIEPTTERGEVRFTHPLLARVPYEALGPAQRRRLHARLAGVLDESEERARHQALAATEPSSDVSEELDRAAAAAGSRGAPGRAAELCTLASRLTPAGCEVRRASRSLGAAEWCHRAGETDRAAALAERLVGSTTAGGDTRARAMSLLATVRADTEGVRSAIALYDAARHEPDVSPTTRGDVHRRLAWLRLGAGEADSAARHARAALACAAGNDPGATAIAGLAEVMGGGPVPAGLAAIARTPGGTAPKAGEWPETAPGIVAAVTLLWGGELEQARPPLEAALAHATERDEPWVAMHALAYLSAIATAGGELRLGLSHARHYLELADASGQGAQRAAALWPLAVALAWQGDEPGARAAAEEGLALASGSGHALYEIGSLSALGVLELSLEHAAEAATALARARRWADDAGVRALGRVPLLPDSVEALALCGEAEAAAALAVEVRRRAAVLGSPWALALADRCEGLVADARGERERAVTALQRALTQHDRQSRPGERARTELALGRTLRRARHKRAAREALERALTHFEAIGAQLWSRQTKRELGRIGGRAASTGGALSETERSIAELVAAGRTNHEVAGALQISAKTVEWNLSKIYRKVGVRGRTQLAAALAAQAGEDQPAVADAKPGGSTG